MPAPLLAPARIAAILHRLDRSALCLIIDLAIAEVDDRDGDPDIEPEDDACAACDDHLMPIPPRWRGIEPFSLDDDHGVCGAYGVDQSKPIDDDWAASSDMPTGPIFAGNGRGARSRHRNCHRLFPATA